MGFSSHAGNIKTSQAKKDANKRWKEKNKEILSKRNKNYYELHKDEILEKKKLEYYLLK